MTSPFFLVALAGYLIASVGAHLHVFTGSARAGRWTPWVLGGAAAAHLAGFGYQSALGDGCPFHVMSPTISLAAWVLAALQLGLYLGTRWAATGAILIPMAFLTLFTGTLFPRPGVPEELLRNVYFSPHVLTTVLGLCAATLAFGAAVLYLAQQGLLKRKQTAVVFSRLPPLAALGKAAHRLAVVGFSMLTLGIGSGILWALQAGWERWYLDPKASATFVAWLVYAVYLGQSGLGGWRGRRSCYFLIAGFALVLVAYFGVNVFPAGLHPS